MVLAEDVRPAADPRPSVTISPDGWYRIEWGGRAGIGPDAESAVRDLDARLGESTPAAKAE